MNFFSKLILLPKPILSLMILFVALSNATKVRAQNTINAQSISIHATFHNVGIQVNYSGDANKNATAALEANINGAGFNTVHRLSRVGNNRFVGTVFSVAPSTNVQVRVTFSDPDGVLNGVQTASIITRSEQVPVSNGGKIHVATTGNDNTGNGSVASPYKTLQKAVDVVMPGNTIAIHVGIYHEFAEIAYKNTATASTPITITNAGDGTVIFDGTDQSFNNPAAWTSEGDNLYSITLNDTYYIGVDGNRLWRYETLADLQNNIYNTNGGFCSVAATSKTYLRLPNNAVPAGHQITVSTLKRAVDIFESKNIIIKGITFKNFNGTNEGAHSSAIQIAEESYQVWITDCVFENMQTAIRLEGYVEDLVVMENEFSDQGITALDWDNVKDVQWWLERGALYITNDGYTGRGTIFYKNNVHEMFDGVKIVGSEDDFTAYATNSDVEENTFYLLSDDGVEVDGFACNVRINNNRFENLLVGVSVAPAQAGPVYIIRNLMVDLNNVASPDWETSAVKFNYDGERSGEIFIYHNLASTFEAEQSALSITNSANWDHLVFRNNIWNGTLYAFYHWLDNTASLAMTQDHDLLYAGSSPYLTLFDGVEYMTVTSYSEGTGLCQTCENGDPLFMNAASGNYNLNSSSPAIDKGILIQGINDNFLGDNPDIGPYEQAGEPLAVDYLEALTATIEMDKVRLNWISSFEENNDYFTIERSQNAKDWNDIGRVDAKGASFSYQAYDRFPVKGKLYYRLKQFDYDRTFSYSNIASVYFEKTSITLSPNPTYGAIELFASKELVANIVIMNARGRKVEQYALQGHKMIFDMSHLPNGMYVISVYTQSGVVTTKVVLQQ